MPEIAGGARKIHPPRTARLIRWGDRCLAVCAVDFPRKEVGRRCLPVGIFHGHAGQQMQATVAGMGAQPSGNRGRAERKVQALGLPSVSRPELLLAPFGMSGTVWFAFVPRRYGTGLVGLVKRCFGQKNLHLSGSISGGCFARKPSRSHSPHLFSVASKGETYRARQATE